MNFVSTYKSELLNTASWTVIDYVCRAGIVIIPNERGGAVGAVWAFLIWIRIWFEWLSGQNRPASGTQIQAPAIINRHDKRARRSMDRRNISPVCSYSVLFHLCGRYISRTQFMELMCKISLYGRVCIYGIKFWGTVLRRRAMLVCYDHGWWRAPLGAMGRVNGGLWRVHSWPD